jgi:NAD(P)-dependent dehydrogenase (short-subunit alcohol dehydrogenase family)
VSVASTWSADLTGRSAVVTGASSGIGVAIARGLADAGAAVALVGRDERRLGASADAIREQGGRCCSIAVDITDDAAPETIVDRTVEAFGSIDVLVNNAGVFHIRPYHETPVELLDEQYRTNLRAPYALTQAALPHMREGSSVVFVTSNAAQGHFTDMAAYAASKGGLESLARALAFELAPRGVRVNAVAPGLVHTPMTSRIDEDPSLGEELVRATPLGRLGQPEDIAAAVVFLASPASSYAVGAVLTVDGGWNLH